MGIVKKLLATMFLFTLFSVFSVLVAAADITKTTSLSGNSITNNYTSYSVNFDSNYISIDQVCLDFTFNNDLLDPSDNLYFSVIPAPTPTSYGVTIVGNASQSTRSSCLVKDTHQATVNEFLDGNVTGSVWMTNGTVFLQSLSIKLVNAVTPAPTPTPSCSLSSAPSSGTGPFSSNVTASYSNLATSPNAVTIDCGTGKNSVAIGCAGTTGSCTATCDYQNVTSTTTYTLSASINGTECTKVTITNNQSAQVPAPTPTPSMQITISLSKTTYYPAESFEPRVTIKDSSGKLITDASIKSNMTGPKTYYPYFFYSSLCDCYKTFHWLGEDVLVGDYTLYFEASRSGFEKTMASVSFKVVKPIIQTFTIATDKKEYSHGDSIKVTITAKDSLGNVIKDLYIPGEIREADTGKLVGPIYPHLSGDEYIYTYYPATPAIGSESLGKSYKISVSTTWKEQKASVDTTVSVVKKGLNADVVLEKNVLTPGDSLKGRIKIYDKDGNTVKDAKIDINVQGSQKSSMRYLSATFKDGFYEIESWKVEDWVAVGNYTLEIKISKYPEEIKLEKSVEITKQGLNVEVLLDKTSYKPGDRVYIKILVTYPNGTVAGGTADGKGAWVSAEIFPLVAEAFPKEKGFYQPGLCRIYPSPIPPVYYKGEFIQKYFIDSPNIPADCPTGRYALKVKVGAHGYADAEIFKEFDVALAKLFIETGFRVNSQVDSVNLVIYAEVKDENGKAIEFASVNGILRPVEELGEGCIKQFSLYYDNFRKRYTGEQFLSKYECAEGSYLIQVKSDSMSYETAEVVQGLSVQYKKGYEYRGYVPATPFEPSCREVSCGPNCIQRICEPITNIGDCFNLVTDEKCVRSCTENLEKNEETLSKSSAVTGKAVAATTDLKECIEKCTMKVPCQGANVPTVPLELMIEKLDELKREVEKTQEDVGGLKKILLFIIDFVNSILSKYLGQEETIKIPSEVVANATNTTNPITGTFVKIVNPLSS